MARFLFYKSWTENLSVVLYIKCLWCDWWLLFCLSLLRSGVSFWFYFWTAMWSLYGTSFLSMFNLAFFKIKTTLQWEQWEALTLLNLLDSAALSLSLLYALVKQLEQEGATNWVPHCSNLLLPSWFLEKIYIDI